MLLQCSVLEGEVQPALDQGSHVLTLEVSKFTRDILRFANTFLKKKKKNRVHSMSPLLSC